MKILHTVPFFCLEDGGTTSSIYNLLNGLNRSGVICDLLTATTDEKTATIEWVKTVKNDCITPFMYSKSIKTFLKDENIYDIYHTNGMWLYCNHITAKIARKKGKPYMITPHGMLYPQSLRNSLLKKKLGRILIFNKDIEKAHCIHATCKQEMEYLKQEGIKTPIAVIPNSVIPNPYNLNNSRICNRICFLGRIHPRKLIEVILYGIKESGIKDIDFYIIGEGDKEYKAHLKIEAKKLNINAIFTGFISGKEKYELLSTMSALIVPSEIENFGMIIPEALSVGVPVIAGKGTPWKDLNTNNCGWWVENTPKSIGKIIKEAVTMSAEQYEHMGINGKKLVDDKYSIDKESEKMLTVYKWLLSRKAKPDFIY